MPITASQQPLIALLLSGSLLIGLWQPLAFIPLVGIILVLLLFTGWLTPHLCLLGLGLFIFGGNLAAVSVGFTLKASQVFALLGLMLLMTQYLSGQRSHLSLFPLRRYVPFLLFIAAVTLSLIPASSDVLFGGGESAGGFRLFFNFLLLQVMAFFIANSLQSVTQLRQLIWAVIASCIGSLAIGYYQIAGFYLGFYDPSGNEYLDFYGPFMRLGPGTFPNEYGQILMVVSILITALLLLAPRAFPRWQRLLLWGGLIVIMASMIPTFTRAAWLGYLLGFGAIALFGRLPLKRLLQVTITVSILTGSAIWGANEWLNFDALDVIGQRFSELGAVSTGSAGDRLDTWSRSLELFEASPLIGQGWGADSITHNVALQLLSETGIIGFLCYYFMMGYVLITLIMSLRVTKDSFLSACSVGVLASLLACLFFDLTNHGIFHFVLWLLVALSFALPRLAEKDAESSA